MRSLEKKNRLLFIYRLLSMIVLVLFFLLNIAFTMVFAATEYTGTSSFDKMLKNTQLVNLPKNISSRENLLFLSALGFLNSTSRTKIEPSDILTKEEALAAILNSAGKQQDAFIRAEKLELKRPSGQKLVKPYNYLFLGYIQLAYDLKILSKQEYQDAMSQVQPSQKEHQKMTQQLMKKNEEIVSKAVYEQRPYSYDDLIFVRSAPATRQEVCFWAFKTFKIPASYENLAKTYPDYDEIDSKFLTAVNTLLKSGALVGRSDGYLHPDDYITYEELGFVLGNLKPYILIANGLKEIQLEIKDVQKLSNNKVVYICEDEDGNDINISIIPGKVDFGVIANGNIFSSSYLKKGDFAAFYVNSKGEVILSSILQRVGEENLSGVITNVDLKKKKVQIKLTDGRTYNLTLHSKASIYDMNTGKSLDISELAVGKLVEAKINKNMILSMTLLSNENNLISRIEGTLAKISKDRVVLNQNGNLTEYLLSPQTLYIDKGDFARGLTKNDFYEGMKVLAGVACGYVQYLSTTFDEKSENTVTGILHELDKNLGYIEIYNQDGVVKSYRYSKKLGVKVKKNGKNALLENLLPGDVVFLYFNGDFVRTITASSNQSYRIAKIENVVKNPSTGLVQKMVVNIDGKIYGPYEIDNNVEVVKDGKIVSLRDVSAGQYVKLTGSFYGNIAHIKKIEISSDENVKNIYLAKGSFNLDTLYLSDINVLRNNTFEPVYSWLSFKISSDVRFILDGNSQQPLSKLQNMPVLVITKERFSQEVVDTVIAISRGTFEKVKGEIASATSNTLIVSGNRYSTNTKTLAVSNGYLVPANFKIGDEIIAVANQGTIVFAKILEGVSKPIFVRGQVTEISELESITVKDYVYLDSQKGWQYVPSKLTLLYDTQTVLCDVYGLSKPEEILNLKNKSVYILHDGKYANMIIDTSFGGYIVSAVIGKDMQLLNVQYNDMMTQVWNRVEGSFKLDTASAIMMDATGTILGDPPQFGDRVLLLVPQTNFDLTKSSISPAVVLVNY